jgi:hypothetical protein
MPLVSVGLAACHDPAWGQQEPGVLRSPIAFGARPVAARPGLFPAHEIQLAAAAAEGRTETVVVWEDRRVIPDKPIVVGARLATDGGLLDPAGVPLAVPWARSPTIVFDGARYLVAWEDRRAGNSNIYGAWVEIDGGLAPLREFPIANTAAAELEPAAAFDGTSVVVAFSRAGSAGTDVMVATVGDGGVGTPLVVSALPGVQSHLRAASGNDEIALVWASSDAGLVYGTVVAGGAAAPPVTLGPGAGAASFPAVAFGQGQFYAVWAVPPAILGGRVALDAGVLDPGGVVLVPDAGEGVAAAGFDGVNYTVAFASAPVGAIGGLEVSTAGAVVPGSQLVISQGPATGLAIAPLGPVSLLAYTRPSTAVTSSDIYGARWSGALALDPPGFLISGAPESQLHPRAVSSRSQHLVVWTGVTFEARLFASRVTFGGAALDSPAITLGGPVGPDPVAQLATDGTDFLVLWFNETAGDVYAARVLADGGTPEPNGFPVIAGAGRQEQPDVAFVPPVYVVVASSGGLIVANAVRPDGTLVRAANAPLALVPGGTSQGQPHIASDGTLGLVTFHDGRSTPWADVWGVRVDSMLGASPAAGFRISQSNNLLLAPHLAWGGGTWLTGWTESPAVACSLAPVSAAGLPGAAQPLPGRSIARVGFLGALFWASDRFVATWYEGSELVIADVDPAGTLVDAGTTVGGVGEHTFSYDGPRGVVAYTTDAVSPSLMAVRVLVASLGDTGASGGGGAGGGAAGAGGTTGAAGGNTGGGGGASGAGSDARVMRVECGCHGTGAGLAALVALAVRLRRRSRR